MAEAAERVASPGEAVDVLDDIVVAHRWATPDKLKQLRAMLPPPAAGAAPDLAQYERLLADSKVLDNDRRTQLETLRSQQRTLPKFRLLRKLGAGGMGTVWLARLDGHDDPLGLKVINARLAVDTDFLGRFTRETKALQGLRHPHIAAVIDSGGTEGVHYLAMEYINGPSLGEMLKAHKALPESYVLRIVRQVAEGLSYVNIQAGLVHRDVKPENILVQRLTEGELFPEDDLAKLIDFGLVKNANDDEHLTQTGMTIGTPLYMSPEQVRGEKLDGRSDIYALGATMYHLLTGTAPFKGTSPGAIMSAHLTEAVPDPGDLVPSLSEATRRLVMMAMAKPVADRFRTFDAMIKAIDEAMQAQHEKDGAMRLLRKPLVIAKKPVARKAGTDAHGNVPNAANITERIARKHGEQLQTGRIGKADAAPAAGGAVPLVKADPVATARLAKLKDGQRSHSDRLAKVDARPASHLPRLADAVAAQSVPIGADGTGEASAFRALTERRESDPAAPAPAGVTDETFNLRPADLKAGTNALTRAHDGHAPARSKSSPLMAARLAAMAAPAAATPAGEGGKRSAVFDEDPSASAGFGILPWTVLAAAIVLAVGFAVWHLVLS